jgi:hypothetical protein
MARINLPARGNVDAHRAAERRVNKEAGPALTDPLRKAWKAGGPPLSKEEEVYVNFLKHVRASASPISKAILETMEAQSTQAKHLEVAVDSYTALVNQLGAVGTGAKSPGLAVNAGVRQREKLIDDLDAVQQALAVAGDHPALKSISTEELAALRAAVGEDIVALSKVASTEALDPKTVATEPQAAKALEKAFQNERFSPEQIAKVSARLPAAARAAFEANLSSAALLVDQTLNAPDYKNTGMGYHNPQSVLAYDRRLYDSKTVARSEARLESSFADLENGLDAALKSDHPEVALEKFVVAGFVREIGVRPDPAWKVSPAAVRRALNENGLLPLRALNETIDQMAPRDPETRPMLRKSVANVTQHVLEGDYRQWRYTNPQSEQQLQTLTPAQRQTWMSGETTELKSAQGHTLKAREEDDLGLLWLTKIGGPSHGFDVGGQSLLPALTNGRTKAIVVDDPRWPSGPAARAYLRMLNVEGQPPQLYLEPLQIDFVHRDQFTSPREEADFQDALLLHAMQKANQMGVALSVDPGLERAAERLGLRGAVKEARYVLEPSAGPFEASDTLSRRHDWLQDHREVTAPLWRLILPPKQAARP